MENALNIMFSPDKGEILLGTQQKKVIIELNQLNFRLHTERIRLLKLEVSAESIRYSICTSKLKIKPNNCVLVGDSLIKVKYCEC